MLRATATRIISPNSIRLLTTTTPRGNLIQDLYLKELTSVKNTLDMSKITSPKGNVLEWKTPAKPTAPGVEAKDDSILQDYIHSKVATMESTSEQTSNQQDLQEEDWLVIDDIQQDSLPKQH